MSGLYLYVLSFFETARGGSSLTVLERKRDPVILAHGIIFQSKKESNEREHRARATKSVEEREGKTKVDWPWWFSIQFIVIVYIVCLYHSSIGP